MCKFRNCSSIAFDFCLSNSSCTALNSLEIRQYSCGHFMHSDEKSDYASSALPLCGIAQDHFYDLLYHLKTEA